MVRVTIPRFGKALGHTLDRIALTPKAGSPCAAAASGDNTAIPNGRKCFALQVTTMSSCAAAMPAITASAISGTCATRSVLPAARLVAAQPAPFRVMPRLGRAADGRLQWPHQRRHTASCYGFSRDRRRHSAGDMRDQRLNALVNELWSEYPSAKAISAIGASPDLSRWRARENFTSSAIWSKVAPSALKWRNSCRRETPRLSATVWASRAFRPRLPATWRRIRSENGARTI